MDKLGIEVLYYSLFKKKLGFLEGVVFEKAVIFGVFASVHRS